jgi:hypothetical protein
MGLRSCDIILSIKILAYYQIPSIQVQISILYALRILCFFQRKIDSAM